MLLYTNQNGNWAGNLADAKKMGGTIIKKNVPKDKPNVLKFLNENKVGNNIMPINNAIVSDVEDKKPAIMRSIATHKESAWTNIKQVVEEASLKELTTAMVIIMTRIDDEIYQEVDK
jgi:hypothetical protein